MADEFMKEALYGIKTFNKKAKEKIGMMKLIELLNEYDKEKGLHTFWKTTQSNKIQIYGKGVCSESYLYSKSYGFIKWLVENDKIDKRKIDTRLVKNVESHYDEDGYWVENSYEDYSNADTLLMLLSISDIPIEDLISYLK